MSDYIPLRDLRPGAVFETCHGGQLAVKDSVGGVTMLADGVVRHMAHDALVREVDLSRMAAKLRHAHEWYAVRWERLRQLIHDDARHIEDAAISVMANGTTDTMDPPTYAQQMASLRSEADLYRRGYEAMGAADISEYLALCASAKHDSERLHELDATLADEEASHQETLRLWQEAKEDRDRLAALLRQAIALVPHGPRIHGNGCAQWCERCRLEREAGQCPVNA